MDADLQTLEDKIAKLIALCVSLREQNLSLRQDLTKSQHDADQLKNNMQEASIRLEVLLNTMPSVAANNGLEA